MNLVRNQLLGISFVQNFTEMLENFEGLMWPDMHFRMSNSGSCSDVVARRKTAILQLQTLRPVVLVKIR